ncbi:mitochondrial carrier [Rhizodiscina lignyota]|uniref:Mitochondrial carrier n=1 Tax=Rhizodiscina lignyota TaxID=1504668 RepID=A0A9P4MA88_9PEZI|nr:mitochondrial carrier [Rhizodiscina lignyota]
MSLDLRDTSVVGAPGAVTPLQSAHEPSKTSTVEVVSEQGVDALKDITFGSIAGVVGKFIEYPFDTVKVRLQSQPDHLPLRYAGPLDCFQQSLRQDGVLGIYRGISAPLFGAAVETSSLFFSYRLAQHILQSTILPADEPLTLPALVACGGASGAFTSLLLTPIELIKCKMQVPLETQSQRITAPSAWMIMKSVYRHQGPAGFWHGQLGTLIRETGGSAAWFGSYEGVSLLFRNLRASSKTKSAMEPTSTNSTTTSVSPINDGPLPIYQQMLAGAAAGMSYNFIFYPADTIKSRMQTEDVSKMTGGRKSFWAVSQALWQQHGLKGLYRGCGITVGRAAPSSALIFTVYEALRTRAHSHDALEKIILNPKYHDVLTLVKGVRNGIVYGTKIRFPHALVMIFLFRSGTLRQKVYLILKATRQHARNLGMFALVYKGTMLLLRSARPSHKEGHYDTFVAGLLGGYTVFGRSHSSVSQQIVIYIFARVCLAYAKLAVLPRANGSLMVRGADPYGEIMGGGKEGGGGWGLIPDERTRELVMQKAWPVFASLSWAFVMYVFRWHPETVQPSLRSSMHYIYVQSDDWDSLRNFLWHNK